MDAEEGEDEWRRGMATVAAPEEGGTAAPQEGQKRLGAGSSVAQEGQRSMGEPWTTVSKSMWARRFRLATSRDASVDRRKRLSHQHSASAACQTDFRSACPRSLAANFSRNFFNFGDTTKEQ